MKRFWGFFSASVVCLLWMVASANSAWADPAAGAPPQEDFRLAGTPNSLAKATRNIINELNQAEPEIAPEDVKIELEVWETEKLGNLDQSPVEKQKATQEFEANRAELENLLHHEIHTTERVLSDKDADGLREGLEANAQVLWPLYEKIAESSVNGEVEKPSFVPIRHVLLESVTNPKNLVKAAARLFINSTLVAVSLNASLGIDGSRAALLGVVAGGLSFCLMAGNDLYKAWLDSPFWTKVPATNHLQLIEKATRLDRPDFGARAKKMVRTYLKDTLVMAAYLAIFTTASVTSGVTPPVLSKIVADFVSTTLSSVSSETSLNAMNARLTTKAIGRLQTEDPIEAIKKIRHYRDASATAALVQSLSLTAIQITATLGSTTSQGLLWAISGAGFGAYIVVTAHTDTWLGRVRDHYFIPPMKAIIFYVTKPAWAIARGTCAALAAVLGMSSAR